MNYPLIKRNKKGTLLHPAQSLYSDECAKAMCSLYLSDEIHKDENGKLTKYYRLHAKDPHNEEMALVYDINCPKCHNIMKQVGRTLNYHDLGLYECKSCEKH